MSLLEDVVIGKKTLLGIVTGALVGLAAGHKLNQYFGTDSWLLYAASTYLVTSVCATSGNREYKRDLGYGRSS